jgi:hypothetical protein
MGSLVWAERRRTCSPSPLPPLPTVKALRLWLGLFDHELSGFADCERRQCKVKETRLHHYRYQWIEKRSGQPRLIEIPKSRLMSVQRQILSAILGRLPPHPYPPSPIWQHGDSTLACRVWPNVSPSTTLATPMTLPFPEYAVWLNPAKGERLNRLWQRIEWPE